MSISCVSFGLAIVENWVKKKDAPKLLEPEEPEGWLLRERQ